MVDNKNDKVLDFFKRVQHKGDIREHKFFKGFPYIKLTKDDNGNTFKSELLSDYANKCCYIISVMRTNSSGTSIYKYKVPYESLLNFLNEFRTNKDYGQVIDIERYIPEDLA